MLFLKKYVFFSYIGTKRPACHIQNVLVSEPQSCWKVTITGSRKRMSQEKTTQFSLNYFSGKK